MNQTAHQADDSQQPLPENVDCPLCCSAVATATRTPRGKVVCDACGLSFSAFDAAERRRRLDAERERLRAEKRRAQESREPEPPVHPLQQWLSGAPWELPRRTSWQQAMLWMRQHRWLAATAALSAVGLLVFCLSLSRSLQLLTERLEEALLRQEQLQTESQKLTQSYTSERIRWQDEREQLQRRLDWLEQDFSITSIRQTGAEQPEPDLDSYPHAEETRVIRPQLPLHLSPLPSTEDEEALSTEDAVPSPFVENAALPATPARIEPPLSNRPKVNNLR